MVFRYGMAVTAGLLLAGAFPKFSIAGLAWIAPGLLLVSTAGAGARQALRLGYVGGLAYWLSSLYWLLAIPFPVGAITGWLALSAYLALYSALWIWACWRLLPNPNAFQRLELVDWLAEFQKTSWLQRVLWACFCAASWVALEIVRGWFLTGFPWNFLGVSQYRILPLVQVASVTGVHGISFLVAWFSTALIGAVAMLVHRPQYAKLVTSDLAAPMAILALTLAFGMNRLRQNPGGAPAIKMALVQPSIPQTLIWDPGEATNRFQRLLDLSELALQARPDILVWPEAAVPNLLRYDPWILGAVTNLASQHRVWMIIGSDDAEPSGFGEKAGSANYYNASFLIDPQGQLRARYCKQKLVVFGEYLPLQPWFFFLKWFTPVRSGFTAGKQSGLFVLNHPACTGSVLICFEDTFLGLVRRSVTPDTDFIVNLTNNGWFGETAAQWQHAANAVFRAVENGRPLVRCSNNGLTCWVDRQGRMHHVYFGDSQDIYRAGFKLVEIPLRAGTSTPDPTFYQRYGDWFGSACVVVVCGLLMADGWRRNRRNQPLDMAPAG